MLTTCKDARLKRNTTPSSREQLTCTDGNPVKPGLQHAIRSLSLEVALPYPRKRKNVSRQEHTAPMTDIEAFQAHQAAVRTIYGLTIRYRLTLDGQTVEVAHSDIDPTLPTHSVRLLAGGDELLIQSAEWVGPDDGLEARVLSWIIGHIDLRGAQLRPGARRRDPVWVEAWRRANPGGR